MLSQEQLANKYGLSQGLVSIILREYNVPVAGRMLFKGSKKPRNVYEDVLAMTAFRDYFRKKADDLRAEANEYINRSLSFRETYERSILFGEEK